MTTRTPRPVLSLAQQIEGHQSRFAARPAAEYLGVTINYRELNALADRLAHVLRSLGLGRGDVLGIHLPNTPQYLVALIAASKLGAAISGVSPLLTPSEIVHQVNDARIKVLLTLDQLYNPAVTPIDGQVPGLKAVLVATPIDVLPGWKKTLAYALKKVPKVALKPMKSVRVLDYWREQKAASSAPVAATQVHPDDTIMIQYTGGTTGKPKGAELTLAQLHSQSEQVGEVCAYEDGKETIASAFPYFHVAGLILAMVAMRHAAQLLVIPDPRNVEMFCQAMRKHPPTLMANVPTLFQMLLEHAPFHQLDFSRLRMAISGAAPFSTDMMYKLEKVIGKGKLCEGYGMTECCGVTVLNPIGGARIGSIGLPLPGTKLKIVDVETGTQEMPVGEPGEVIISGGQIMKGYLNNPEATAKTIRVIDGARWLHTGDIAVQDADGYVTICDRAKDMLIVGGYKVFSVEVEGKLGELDCVEMSAVIGTPDEKRPGNDIVNLHVQLSAGHKQRDHRELEAEIIGFCREHMAAYKIPKTVRFHDALPLTAVGKLDKKALRV